MKRRGNGKRKGGALRAFMTKEVRHILRDRQTLTILLLMPLVQVVLFGFALRSDVRSVRVAVVDPAPDFATRALTTRLAATRRFQLVGVGATARDVEPLFRAGRADIAVIFEPGFGARLGGQGAQPARLMLAVDASDPNSGTTMLTYVRAVIAAQEAEWLGAGTGRSTGVRLHVESRMRFNPTLESVNLFVPGLIALVLTLVCALMSAISLSREKERGTLEVLLVSPLRPIHIIAGKVIPYLGLAFANVLTALAAAWLVFGVPFRGSLVLLLAASMLFSIVSLGIGVLVAARTTSQRAAMLTAMLATLLPSTLLSGMVFPIASMPAWLALISNVVPARWFIVIARGVMLKGVGIAHLWPELLVLTGMMVVLLAAATRSFKPRLA
jgi:ABC-2 type transport system permease protein